MRYFIFYFKYVSFSLPPLLRSFRASFVLFISLKFFQFFFLCLFQYTLCSFSAIFLLLFLHFFLISYFLMTSVTPLLSSVRYTVSVIRSTEWTHIPVVYSSIGAPYDKGSICTDKYGFMYRK